MTKKLILCDCLGTQSLDAAALGSASGRRPSRVLTEACGHQLKEVSQLVTKGGVMIACEQQARLFRELAEDIDAEVDGFVDVRDRAGWSDDADEAGPKMAALVAEAALPAPTEKSVDVVSDGVCLVIGTEEVALEAANALSETLAVTVLLSEPADMTPENTFDVVAGRLTRAAGTFGEFDLRIDGFRQMIAGGRGAAGWSEARDGAKSTCDLIVDLSGGTPLFPAPEKRDGYLRADPGSQAAVAKVLRDATHMVGTFEKTLYVRLEAPRCAHSRTEQTACTKCFDVCPTGAIASAGEHVAINPLICAGCGACASVCPSEAIIYDAPPVSSIFARLAKLAGTYRSAGGGVPRLLVHDAEVGRDTISMAARYGRGLPADVIPFEVSALASYGHAEMMAALATGFGSISILLTQTSDRDVITNETELACALAGSQTVSLIDERDPDLLSEKLYGAPAVQQTPDPILPIGGRRQVARLAAKTLQPDAETLALPAGAPYGTVLVDTEACTLCLSCASLCPAGALVDNPDAPQLRFQEDACLQCGLCVSLCPEDAITLKPQLDLTDAAFDQRVLHEEDPFACIECGALFGVKSTVERITEKLAGNHAMFSRPETIRMIQMCDNCRIQAQFHSTDNPLAAGERPRVRTTDDYLSKRRDH
ncbi:MAG: 4Fe-4S binding protein [Pseudomonadota bacterium]